MFRFETPQPGNKETAKITDAFDEPDEGLDVQSLVFEIHGSHFEIRPTDRATKKLKQRKMNDL